MRKINSCYVYFIIILLLMIIGAMSKYLIFFSIIASVIVAIIMSVKHITIKTSDVCIGIIILLCFQNFCIGIGAHIANNTSDSLKYLTQIPFLTIFIIWFNIEIYKFKNDDIDFSNSKKFFIILLLCIIFSILIKRYNIQSMLMNFRNLTVFYMGYEIGKFFIKDKIELEKFLNNFFKIIKTMFYAGIILYIIGYPLYKAIGIEEVYIAKGSPLQNEKFDGRFYTTLISNQYQRMGSLYYEPVNLAYLFAIAFLISIFYDKKKISNIFISASGLILTFGKGGYIIVGAVFLCLGLEKTIKIVFNKISRRKIYKFAIISMLGILTIFAIYYYKNIGAAVAPHFWGIIRTWTSVVKQPYGHGLGSGGNMAQILDNTLNRNDWMDTGGETALMSFTYQIGIQGLVSLVLVFISMSKEIVDKDNKFRKIFVYLPYILLAVSLLQDNTFTPQCIVIYMILQGALCNDMKEKTAIGE